MSADSFLSVARFHLRKADTAFKEIGFKQGNAGMLRLMGLPNVARFPQATVTRDDEKMYIRFGGLVEEHLMSVPLKYIGAEDEEAAALQLLAQLQKIGYEARRGRPGP